MGCIRWGVWSSRHQNHNIKGKRNIRINKEKAAAGIPVKECVG